MDDACPELGHYLTTACDKVRRQIQFAIDLLYLHRQIAFKRHDRCGFSIYRGSITRYGTLLK